MKARGIAHGVILAAIGVLGSVALAGAPLGVPIAALEEQEWAVGVEYGYEKGGLEGFGSGVRTIGGVPAYFVESVDIDDLATRMVFGSLAYGVCDNWDLFLRVGAADGRGNIRVQGAPPGGSLERSRYNSNYGVAWGIGSRATFCHWGPWRFGGLVQATWFDAKCSDFLSTDPDAADTVFAGSSDLEFWQTQVALAAVYQIDTLRFWAGPFLQFVEGDMDRSGRVFVSGVDDGSFQGSTDIGETSQFGLHAGVDWEVTARINCRMEGQLTRDGWLLGISGAMRLEELLGGF
jgi:hypothetical protein